MKIARKLGLGLFAPLAVATVGVACLVGTVSFAFAQVDVVEQRRAEINTASREIIKLYDSIKDKEGAKALESQISTWIGREEAAEKALADAMPGLDLNNPDHARLLEHAFIDIESTDVAERAAWGRVLQRQADADIKPELAREKEDADVINAPR